MEILLVNKLRNMITYSSHKYVSSHIYVESTLKSHVNYNSNVFNSNYYSISQKYKGFSSNFPKIREHHKLYKPTVQYAGFFLFRKAEKHHKSGISMYLIIYALKTIHTICSI